MKFFKNKMLFVLAILIAIPLTGCFKQVVCNDPYIFVGSECCLDKNKNQACDKDEINKNINTTYILMDLQKTLSTIFGKDILLSKDNAYEDTQFYSNTKSEFVPISSCTSGCAGSVHILKLDFDEISVGYINQGPKITEYQFYDYISSKKNYFLNQSKEIQNKFEDQFKTEAGLQRYFDKKDIREYPFANFSISKTEILDNFTKITTLSDNSIVEFDYAAINEYNVYYGSKKIAGFINRKEKRLDFLQSINIYCTPELVITLYGKRYDWRTLINKNIYPADVINQFDVNREFLLPKAKAILNLCMNKYAYGEFKIE